MEILIIIGLILLNGLFSMSEIALVSARKASLKNEAKSGNKAAQAALRLSENPDNFLSTVQVGITLIGIITGLYSGDVLAAKASPILESWGMSSKIAYPLAQVVIVIVVTYITIVFGELVPKRIGLSLAEKVSKLMARPMNIISKITYPFVFILSKSTALVSKLLGVKENANPVTEEEIKIMIREGKEIGEVQQVEQDIVERVFNLGDRDLESIMTPRHDLVWIDNKMNKQEIEEIIENSPYSKLPVGSNGLNNIEGFVNVKDIYFNINKPDFDIMQWIRPVQYFYENKEVYSALETMKQNHNYYAVVTDEFGSVSGIVTLRDIMEAIVGDIPEHNEEPEIIERNDGSFLVNAQIPFYDFLQYFDMGDLYPIYECNTFGGLILEELGHIPTEGETLEWQTLHIEIVDMDGVRIDKVIVIK